MLGIVVAVGSLVASLLGAPTQSLEFPEDVQPPKDGVTVQLVTVNGSGCRAGTAAVAVSPDNTAFTVTYSDYLAQVGVGARPTDARKNCQLSVKVLVPHGFTYAIAAFDGRGFATLAKGATAVHRSSFYFQGDRLTPFIDHNIPTEWNDSFAARHEVPFGALVFRPCGQTMNVNVNTELRVNVGTSDPRKTTSFATIDAHDLSLKTIYRFTWKTCPR